MKILHPTDFSDCAMKALTLAQNLAERLNATVDVAHVVASDDISATFPDLDIDLSRFDQELKQRLEATLSDMRAEREQHLKERLEALCPPGGTALSLWGRPFKELYQRLQDYDLVVMGAHGANRLDNFVLGGLAGRLVRRSPIPVLTVREETEITKLARMLVATDFSDAAKHAWVWTHPLAKAGVKRVAAHIMDDAILADRPPYVKERTDTLSAFATGVCESKIIRAGRPVRDLPRIAQEISADVIVIGNKQHATLAGLLLGSRADALLRSSPVPILSVPLIQKNDVLDL